MDNARAFFLVLDGDEKAILKEFRRAGLEEAELLFPMLPQSNRSRRTVWWASAARLFNSFMERKKPGAGLFYWGPSRFAAEFLRDAGGWAGEEAVCWSRWERVRDNGILRFNGALGVLLPQPAVGTFTLPGHLGNRFFIKLLEEELTKLGVPFRLRGKPWPAPAQELETVKGRATVTLAAIVRDEEEFLAGCLEQALPYVDRIVVVDTGSRDRTPEIARAYGADVVFREWEQDFATARNAYLERIADGWVLTLDADEYLTPEAGLCLRRLAEKGEPKVYYLRTYNYHSESVPHFTDQANVRLFYRTSDARYVGKIHEQLVASLPKEMVGGPVVLHYGYLPSVVGRKSKLVRNEEILEDSVAECGTPFDWYNLGLTRLSVGRAAEALEALERYLELESPEKARYRPSAYWHAARAALACGRKELALEYAEKACEAPLPECYFTKGQVLESLGRVDEAVAAYRQAASLPDPPASLYQVFNQSDSSIKLWRASLAAASLLEKQKRYAEAEQDYRRALAGDMGNLAALVGVAWAKRLQDRHREALKWAKRAVEAHPAAVPAHTEYIEALLAAGELAAAKEHLDRSGLPPGAVVPLYLRLASAAVDAEDFGLALEAAELSLRDGGSLSALVLKTRALRALGRLAEAEDTLRGAPAHPEVENERGCVLLARGALDEAEDTFRRVLAQDPTHAAAATNLAQVLVLKGRVEEALATVSPFATAAGESVYARAVLLAARCLNSLRRYREALDLLGSLEGRPLPPGERFEASLVAGNAWFGLQDWAPATNCYLEAYRANPDDPELLFRIGLLMINLHRWTDAENALLNVLRLDPSNAEARRLLDLVAAFRAVQQAVSPVATD
ncbi:MAG: tetratricopeptide repeat protein [Moorellales bacterium]